jgi:16S rRNA G966 N2-methylase RsmD
MREMPPLHPAADLFPLLEGQEFIDLIEDIRSRGLNEPVWMYGDVLLDGRNRWRACNKAGVKVRTRRYVGDDPLGFSIAQNVKRRHLDVGQRAAIALRALPLFAKEAARRQREAGRYGREGGRGKKKPPSHDRGKALRAPTSAALAAKTVGVSARSVENFKWLQSTAPDLARQVEVGAQRLSRACRIARDRISDGRKRAALAPPPAHLRAEVRLGAFQEVLSDMRDVDAVITDPPYEEASLQLLRDLALFADRALKPNGVLAVMYSQDRLPQAFERLSVGRSYRWTMCVMVSRKGWLVHPRKVLSSWKPVLIFGGGRLVSDVIEVREDDIDDGRRRHPHGQSLGAFRAIVERLTRPGDLVVDPCAGGGTTLIAATQLGRHAIGCDVDAACMARVRRLLGVPTKDRRR